MTIVFCRIQLLIYVLTLMSVKLITPHYFIHPSHQLEASWLCHQMETFSALLAICVGNSQVTGEFPTQRPVRRSFDVYFDLHPNKSWGWWSETPSRPLWRHRNVRCLFRVISTKYTAIVTCKCVMSHVIYLKRNAARYHENSSVIFKTSSG